MKKLIFTLFCLFLMMPCLAYYDDITDFKILYVYDGDTIYIEIPQYPPLLGKHIGVRLRGINAPEMKASKKFNKLQNIQNKLAAIRAKEMLQQILSKSKVIKLVHVGRGKYFRILADVEADGMNVSDAMLKMGLAVPFMVEE